MDLKNAPPHSVFLAIAGKFLYIKATESYSPYKIKNDGRKATDAQEGRSTEHEPKGLAACIAQTASPSVGLNNLHYIIFV